MKKILSIMLAICMLFSVSAISVDAFASTGTSSIDVDQLNANMPTLSSSISSSREYNYNGKAYYSDGRELYDIVRSALDKASTSVTFNYYTSTPFYSMRTFNNKMSEVISYAWSDEMSVTSTDGDYAHWSVKSINMNYDVEKTGYYNITIKFGYYNTPEQEKEVDSVVNSIVNSIASKDWSDYEVLKYVHDYICNSTTYNNSAVYFSSRYPTSFTAYGALIGGRVVCQGYAVAFYRICRELGYDVRFVYSGDKGNHAWNMVRLDNKTYYIDCTWDDNIMDDDDYLTDPDIMGDTYFYFLVDYDTLRSLDGTNDKTHVLDTELTNDADFKKNYLSKESSTRFDESARHLSMCKEKLEYSTTSYSNGAKMPSITITNSDGVVLEKDVDYHLSYSKNTNCGRAIVKINGFGDYAGMSSVRTFIIKPSKASTPSLVTDGRTKSSLNIKWTKLNGGVSGYQVQQYDNGEWKTIKTITSSSTTSYKISSLKACKKYQFRVRGYKNVGKVKQYGTASNAYTTYTSPSTPSIKLSTKSKAITVKWGKVSCTGYEVQYSTNSSMKNAKTVKASSSAVSKTIKSLKKGKKYYIRVRSYKTATVNGRTNTYRSPWSVKKSITVK